MIENPAAKASVRRGSELKAPVLRGSLKGWVLVWAATPLGALRLAPLVGRRPCVVCLACAPIPRSLIPYCRGFKNLLRVVTCKGLLLLG